jgi:EmrB/QacA subfamily drug resistance transporter
MPRPVNKTITLIITTIAGVITSLMMSAVHIALPTMGNELSIDAVLLGWVITAMTLPQVAVLLAAGRFADIYGRKKVFLYGMVLFTVGSFLCAIANSAATLIIFRVIQGIAGGMSFGTLMAIITSVFPGEERGRAIGTVTGATFIGLAAGPFYGGALTEQFGWRSIFYVSAVLCLAAVILIIWKMKGEWAEARGEKFDVAGSVVFGISIVILIYGFTVLPSTLGFILVVLGIVGLLAFIRLELRTESPVLHVEIFRRNRVFVFSNLAMLIHFSAVFASVFLVSLFLQYTLGYSPQNTGIIMLGQMVPMALLSPVAGRISDRIDPRVIASFGMMLISVGLLMFIFLAEETTLWYVIIGLVVLGTGSGIFSSPNSNAVMGSVEKKFLGVAAGIQGTMRSSGQMIGMAIVMILFSFYIGDTAITPEYYPAFLTSTRVAFIIFTALGLSGVLIQYIGMKK